MKQTFLKLHISILLAGFTGVFGKLITLNEGLLVWYRILLTTILFIIILLATKKLERISLKGFINIGKVGCILGLHWVFFYGSIKASNISIGVVCYSLVGFFTAVLEPIILHRRLSLRELAFSLITLLGVALIFSFDTRYRTGIALGVVSSALAALFTITTKRVGQDYAPHTILLYEILGGFLMMSCLLPLYLYIFPTTNITPTASDVIYLLFLAFFCTIVLQLLQIQVLKKISAFTVSLSYNLEPIYSIILAMLIFGEAKELNPAFYIGVMLIILSVLLQMWATTHHKNQPLAVK